MIRCCIGIMAYNEEANIRRLMEALLAQKTEVASIDEIVVVASGCTDRTEEIAREFLDRDPRVRVLVQPRKEGKASAVNLLMQNTNCEVIVLESADTLPRPETIEELIKPLQVRPWAWSAATPCRRIPRIASWAIPHTCCGSCTTRSP